MVENAKKIDGLKMAHEIEHLMMSKVIKLKENHNITPNLSVILVGDNPASQIYVRMKKKAAKRVGIEAKIHHLPADTSEGDVLKLIRELNDDTSVHGILVQLPLPKGYDPAEVMNTLHPLKDVDGLHIQNAGVLASGGHALVPCTPLGVITMIKSIMPDLTGKSAVVIGRSNLVGKPLAQMLLQESCTVTICHSKTKNIQHYTTQADILVSAVGVPHVVKPDWVKPSAMVIDVGISRLSDGRVVGDVDPNVANVAGYLTPVPGGVGPMTIASLLSNTVTACCLQNDIADIF